jgi:hypothetical protein
MGRVEENRQLLRSLPSGQWDRYLSENSGLPGPRGNLELAFAVAEEAPATLIRRYAGSQDEYQAVCGAIGLGRLAAGGDEEATGLLHELASDSRWRVREGVAMGLQRLGDTDPSRLLELCDSWLGHSWLVDRAVIAGLCEPRLLVDRVVVDRVLDTLDEVTASVAAAAVESRRSDEFRVLRKALAYCWSVAVAAMPGPGFDRFERWAEVEDRDVAWVVRANLGKSRMRKADPARWGELASVYGQK